MDAFTTNVLASLPDEDVEALSSGNMSAVSDATLERLARFEEDKAKYLNLVDESAQIDRDTKKFVKSVDPETQETNARLLEVADDGTLVTVLKEAPKQAARMLGSMIGSTRGAVVGALAGAPTGPVGALAGGATGAAYGGVEGGDFAETAMESLMRSAGIEYGDSVLRKYGVNPGQVNSFGSRLSRERMNNDPIENPSEYLFNAVGALPQIATSIGKQALPSVAKRVAGGADALVDKVQKGAGELSKGNFETLTSSLGVGPLPIKASEGLSRTLRDGRTVAQKAIEVLARPEYANSTQFSEVAKKVSSAVDSLGKERMALVKGADAIGARLVPVVDDVLKEIAAKTGGVLPTETGLTDDVISRVVDVMGRTFGASDEAAPIVDDMLAGLNKLKTSLAPSEALELGQQLRSVRNALIPYGNPTVLDEFSQVIDDIAKSLDSSVKASLNGAVANGRRGFSFDSNAFDAITDEMSTMYKLNDIFPRAAIKAAGKAGTAEGSAVINSESDTLLNKGLEVGAMLSRPLRKVTGLGKQGLDAAQKAANAKEIPAAAMQTFGLMGEVSPTAPLAGSVDDIARQAVLSGRISPSDIADSGMAGAASGELFTQATPDVPPQSIEEIMAMGGAVPSDQVQPVLTEDPLVDGIDRDAFYADKINVPDESSDAEPVKGPELDRSTAKVMEWMSKTAPEQTGVSTDTLDAVRALLSGTDEDQREGVKLLAAEAPQLFKPSKIPGIESMVDDTVLDDAEIEKLETKINSSLDADPYKKFILLNKLRSKESLPSWGLKYMGGKEELTFEDAFLEKEEGLRTDAYMDTRGNPTIGIGVNLGAQSVSGLRDAGVPERIVMKVAPLLGVTGETAKQRLKNSPVKLDKAEAMELSNVVKKVNRETLERQWSDDTGATLDNIPVQARTVMLSLAYNFGNVPKKLPTIWNAATMGRWDEVARLLKETTWKQPELEGRRQREAALLSEIVPDSVQMASNSTYDYDATTGEKTLPDGEKIQTYKF